MSFVIGNKFFSNTLSADRIREYAANKHESPLVMTLWERVKDFFFGGETKECIRLLNDICHPPIASTTLEISQNFDALKKMAKEDYKDRFISNTDGQFTITDNQNNTIISIAIYHKFYTLALGGDKIAPYKLFLAPFPPTAASFKEPMTPCDASEVYEKRLQIWCDENEDCENEKRAQARDDIISARVNKNDTLTLENCHLAALPPLYAPLGTLISRGNPLSRFDAPLPATLEEFDAEGIECLPTTFHPDFRTLKVVSSTALKEDDLDHLAVRAKNLESLTVIGCDRKRLPCNLPGSLKFIHFADNPQLANDAFDDLAEKLPKLEKLVIVGNALKRLPRNLPPSLKELIVKNNQIEELSENVANQLPKLTFLDMRNNKLTKPPMTGDPLPKFLRIETTGNPIPNNTPRDVNRIAELEKELAHMKNLFTKVLTDKRKDEEKFYTLFRNLQEKSKVTHDEIDNKYDRTIAEYKALCDKDKEQYKVQCDKDKEQYKVQCEQDVKQYKKICDIEKEQYMKQYGAQMGRNAQEEIARLSNKIDIIEQNLKLASLPRNNRSNRTTIKKQQTTATPDKTKKNFKYPQTNGWNNSIRINQPLTGR